MGELYVFKESIQSSEPIKKEIIKTEYKITLNTEAPKCPECNVGMKFENRYANEDYVSVTKGCYRCVKCFNLYVVERVTKNE